jgi:hypothetical protein
MQPGAAGSPSLGNLGQRTSMLQDAGPTSRFAGNQDAMEFEYCSDAMGTLASAKCLIAIDMTAT